jgi:hypothetical protein
VVIIIPQFKKVKINLFSTSPSAGILKLQPICKRSSENGVCEYFLVEFLFFCPIIDKNPLTCPSPLWGGDFVVS